VGAKGEGKFERITWDQALDEIVHQYRQIISKSGSEAILPYSYAGTMGVVHFHAGHPFFHKLGASKLFRTICSAAAEAGFSASMGSIPTTDIETSVNSDLIIIWGSNTLSTNMHAWSFFLEARRNGASIVVIDPYKNRTAKEADRHLKLKPGTDAALALGMMHVIIKEDLIDQEFIGRHTTGFDQLAERVGDYPPSLVENITGVPATEIEWLAREYAQARAPYIRTGWGPSRQLKGGMAMRTIALLPGLVGATHKRGGGITRSTSAAFAFNMNPVMREDLAPSGVRSINMVQLGQALTAYNNPPIKALHVYHSNPAVVAPDSARVLAGLERKDLFVVVHEHLMTETAMYADIVLPSTTSLESTDLYRSYGHYYLQMARPVIEPVGETRSTLAIFNDLAARFAFTDNCFSETEEERIRNLLNSDSPYLEGITLDDLQEGRPIRLNVHANIFSKGFGTPSGKIEFYSRSMADQGLDPLPNGEPSIDGEGKGRFDLQLITPPRHQFLNSSFNEIEYLRNKAGDPVILIHPEDAATRGVEEKMRVRVFNDRGECYLYAHLTGDTAPGVSVIEGLYWPRFMPNNRGVNQLTSQSLTDMGQSCAFHCNLVEVEPSLD
ncbi:MAG: molybdopterin oxidoreductase family protein, partial [Deltaproteobacteria bacterium]|nr:molybdopterin oxidoreductase family protein [Deltaproteobacteria bacterium]